MPGRWEDWEQQMPGKKLRDHRIAGIAGGQLPIRTRPGIGHVGNCDHPDRFPLAFIIGEEKGLVFHDGPPKEAPNWLLWNGALGWLAMLIPW